MGTFNSRKRRRATMQNEPPFLADNGHINRTTRAHLARPRHCVQPHTRAAREQRDDSKQPSSQLRARLPASRTHKITHNATQRSATHTLPLPTRFLRTAQRARAHTGTNIVGIARYACSRLHVSRYRRAISERLHKRPSLPSTARKPKKHIRAALASALLPKARLYPCTNSNC